MGDKHDNSEYENPTSRTAAAPPPPNTFRRDEPEADVDSSAAYRQDIRDGMSDAEAQERAEQRAEEQRAAAESASEDEGSEAAGDDGPTKEQLVERAKELDIEGRSSMNKEQLQEAIAAAEAGGDDSDEN